MDVPAAESEESSSVKQSKTVGEILSSNASNKASERRLVEYFLVVSSVPRKALEDDAHSNALSVAQTTESVESEDDTFVDDFDFQPVISSRYPLEDHKDNELHDSVTSFCHPRGSIHLRVEACLPKIHYFVMTGGKGKQMYGTCLTMYESYMISSRKNNDTSKKREVFLPKCICILSTYPFLIAFREYLTQLHRLSKMGTMPLPVERYIANFCSEIPVPPPGSFEVQTTILDSVIKFWSPPNNQPIAWVSLPFSHLFECLDIDNIITVWHALVLERQVLFTSTQLSLLTVCTEILVSLLFPMRWSHAYIPVLPHFLIPILSAPMPYLCGLHKQNLPDAVLDLSRECIIVDLDTNQVKMGPATAPLPPIPYGYANELREKVEKNAGMIFREARSLTKKDDYSERGQHLPLHVKMMADAMWESKLVLYDEAFNLAFTPEQANKNFLNGNDNSGMESSERDPFQPGTPVRIMSAAEKLNLRKQSQWDAVQEAFLNTFVHLLRHYRRFMIFPSKENEGAYGGAGFRAKDFINQQRYDMKEFLRQLIGTQMFDNFVTKRLYGSGEADVIFFDEAVDKYLKTHGLMNDVKDHAMGGLKKLTTVNLDKRATLPTNGNSFTGKKNGVAQLFQRRSNPKKMVPNNNQVKEEEQEPLLQSSSVRRKLKTVVPPDPNNSDLPVVTSQDGTAVITSHFDDDDRSVGSTSTTDTHSTRSTLGTRKSLGSAAPVPNRISGSKSSATGYSSAYKRRQEQLAESLEREKKYCYMYPTFPSELDENLFGTPRPLPAAVLAEFDRQRENAAKFRRKKPTKINDKPNPWMSRQSSIGEAKTLSEISSSAEIATFTVFFMSFTAVVGKELMELAEKSGLDEKERTILATYIHPTEEGNVMKPMGACFSDEKKIEKSNEVVAQLKESNDDTSVDVEKNEASNNTSEDEKKEESIVNNVDMDTETVQSQNSSQDPEKARNRFFDSYSRFQIEEAKATSRAKLGLAFEMLEMMRKRGLKCDPAAYQCLIDACGRCGDTDRATKLLARMHEDGIVADGVVYSCLVSAFSTETAWRKVSGEKNEDLPDWANGASVEMDWNKLRKKKGDRWGNIRMGLDSGDSYDSNDGNTGTRSLREGMKRIMDLKIGTRKQDSDVSNKQTTKDLQNSNTTGGIESYVSDTVLRQILLGENLIEIVYPDISIDTDNEYCPRCNTLLADDEVVAGWTPNDSQDYTTKCPICSQKFVPRFCVQNSSSTFKGSKGLGSPLLCERLSPWVLAKELRSVMGDSEGIENLLNPEWREKETKNAVLWWNLILSYMRFRFPFTFLLQGSFDQNLIQPTPDE